MVPAGRGKNSPTASCGRAGCPRAARHGHVCHGVCPALRPVMCHGPPCRLHQDASPHGGVSGLTPAPHGPVSPVSPVPLPQHPRRPSALCPVSPCPWCPPCPHVPILVPPTALCPPRGLSPCSLLVAVSLRPGPWHRGVSRGHPGVTGGHRPPAPLQYRRGASNPGGAVSQGAPRGSAPLCAAGGPALWCPPHTHTWNEPRRRWRGGREAGEREQGSAPRAAPRPETASVGTKLTTEGAE